MSRWNFVIVKINYRPTELVLREIWMSFGFLIVYFVTMIILFIWDLVPAVRGSADLLGLLILRYFFRDDTTTKYFWALRMFGFFFHLYSVYAARAITLWVILYCKLLENLARKWNIRFAHVFGMLGRYVGPGHYITYHTVIPFSKLFVEHKVITAYSRYTGKIFAVALLAYFLTKVRSRCEYRLF